MTQMHSNCAELNLAVELLLPKDAGWDEPFWVPAGPRIFSVDHSLSPKLASNTCLHRTWRILSSCWPTYLIRQSLAVYIAVKEGPQLPSPPASHPPSHLASIPSIPPNIRMLYSVDQKIRGLKTQECSDPRIFSCYLRQKCNYKLKLMVEYASLLCTNLKKYFCRACFHHFSTSEYSDKYVPHSYASPFASTWNSTRGYEFKNAVLTSLGHVSLALHFEL